MNAQIKEINEIIALCDRMIEYIDKNGIIRTDNPEYETYKKRISTSKWPIDSRKRSPVSDKTCECDC